MSVLRCQVAAGRGALAAGVNRERGQALAVNLREAPHIHPIAPDNSPSEAISTHPPVDPDHHLG
ncbi:hypothetical protein [Sulfitobacter mediterraneus]|uniref:hypothetical protein n=1 Tax=Sulfitobacter mediterraneus TaxID=83219 RepID=UPI000EA3B3A3|nr:hypothetical protein [Sulfitobacter mediterraneus]